MSDPICNLCNKPCDIMDMDQPMYTDAGFNLGPRTIYVSFCCGFSYRHPAKTEHGCIAREIQRDELASRAAQRRIGA